MFEAEFPKLNQTAFQITSFPDSRYNCVAWAAGEQHRWWEPDAFGLYYWPSAGPREYTVEAYVAAFESLGFASCDSADYEPGFEKIAIFALVGKPTHATRQLATGKWTSKLGKNLDLEHVLEGLEGPHYGSVVRLLKRPSPLTS